MTVAVVVKVFDGLVLAADSATTLRMSSGEAQVYNHADKLFHLHRNLPIGAMTWGLGHIGAASISTIAKDLRLEFMGDGERGLDPATYTVEEVAHKTRDWFHDLFAADFDGPAPAPLGLLVTGYSAGSKDSEGWLISLRDSNVKPEPQQVIRPDESGYIAYAQPEASDRLFGGIDRSLAAKLLALVPPERRNEAIGLVEEYERSAVLAAMPFPDAIAFAKFLVDVTAGYAHFLPGPDTVGGKVDVAGINRHEGFKWISRKHYYPSELNPR